MACFRADQPLRMTENPIAITLLNDFVFCPASIFFHGLDAGAESLASQCSDQINGSASHAASDSGDYSDRKTVLQAIPVYCEQYGLVGKIDVFDISTGVLTERKRQIKTVYDGYVFQLYAQYFSLSEMGYTVKELRLYSMIDNKKYPVPFPDDDPEMFERFLSTLHKIRSFNFDGFRQDNGEKCLHCIYEPLCSFAREVSDTK